MGNLKEWRHIPPWLNPHLKVQDTKPFDAFWSLALDRCRHKIEEWRQEIVQPSITGLAQSFQSFLIFQLRKGDLRRKEATNATNTTIR